MVVFFILYDKVEEQFLFFKCKSVTVAGLETGTFLKFGNDTIRRVTSNDTVSYSECENRMKNCVNISYGVRFHTGLQKIVIKKC